MYLPQVLCVGQIVCAVVAETEAQAKRAVEETKIAYEDLEPVIFTIEVSGAGQSLLRGCRIKSAFVNLLMRAQVRALLLSRHWLALEKSAFSGRQYLYELKLA